MTTPRITYFRVLQSVKGEAWSNDQLAAIVRLMAHLDARWAAGGIDERDAGDCCLSSVDVMAISGKRRLDVALTSLQRLANVIGTSSKRCGDVFVIRWPKFPITQGYEARNKARIGPKHARKAEQSRAEQSRGNTSTPPEEDPDSSKPAKISFEAHGLTEEFSRARFAAFPNAKPPTPSAYREWQLAMERLLRIDGKKCADRTPENVKALIGWLFQSEASNAQFWRKNVMSVPKLRERWDQLAAARGEDEERGASNGKRRTGLADRAIRRLEEQGHL